jgi:hypothetical protein
MARPGLHKSDVKQAFDELTAQGRYASVDSVRVVLGNRGSKSTIHKYLKELETETGTSGPSRVDTACAIRNLVDELTAQLHANADSRIADFQAEQVLLLRQQAEEITALRTEVLQLRAQLRHAQGAPGHYQADDSSSSLTRGFGVFQDLVKNDRAGTAGFSKFDTFFNSRSIAINKNTVAQGDDIFWRI